MLYLAEFLVLDATLLESTMSALTGSQKVFWLYRGTVMAETNHEVVIQSMTPEAKKKKNAHKYGSYLSWAKMTRHT